jgi:hypothetical protein
LKIPYINQVYVFHLKEWLKIFRQAAAETAIKDKSGNSSAFAQEF